MLHNENSTAQIITMSVTVVVISSILAVSNRFQAIILFWISGAARNKEVQKEALNYESPFPSGFVWPSWVPLDVTLLILCQGPASSWSSDGHKKKRSVLSFPRLCDVPLCGITVSGLTSCFWKPSQNVHSWEVWPCAVRAQNIPKVIKNGRISVFPEAVGSFRVFTCVTVLFRLFLTC